MEKSIEIMIHQLKAVIGFQEESVPISGNVSSSAKATEDASLGTSAAKVKIADLNLSTRITSALEDAGIKSAAGLARKSASALKELDGIGEKAVEEISEALAGYGLTLKSE